jgi:rhodanese-related sulfurtransferase
LLRNLARKGLKAVRAVAGAGVGFVRGQEGVGYGVGEYDDIARLRAEARAQDANEGNTTDEDDLEAISDGTKEISAEDLRIMMEVEEDEDLPILVDVREDQEWAQGHLPGAVHVRLATLEDHSTDIDRNRIVITYCHAGVRSIDGSYVLKRAGFPRVMSLAGGIVAWREAGNEIITP